MKLLRNFGRDERGQDLIEYSLIAMILALGAIVGLTTLATKINAEFTKIGNNLT